MILGLGALAAVVAPVATAAQCGGSSKATASTTKAGTTTQTTNPEVNELDLETLLTSNPIAQAINKRLEQIVPGLTLVDLSLVIAEGGHSTSSLFNSVLNEMKKQFSANPIPGVTLGTDPISIVKVSDNKADAKVVFVTSTGQKMVSKISILKSLNGKDLDAYATKFVKSLLGGTLEIVDANLFNSGDQNIQTHYSSVFAGELVNNAGLYHLTINVSNVDNTRKNISLSFQVIGSNANIAPVTFVLKSA